MRIDLKKEEWLRQTMRLAALTLLTATHIIQGCTINKLEDQIKSNRSRTEWISEVQELEVQNWEKVAEILKSHQQILETIADYLGVTIEQLLEPEEKGA